MVGFQEETQSCGTEEAGIPPNEDVPAHSDQELVEAPGTHGVTSSGHSCAKEEPGLAGSEGWGREGPFKTSHKRPHLYVRVAGTRECGMGYQCGCTLCETRGTPGECDMGY